MNEHPFDAEAARLRWELAKSRRERRELRDRMSQMKADFLRIQSRVVELRAESQELVVRSRKLTDKGKEGGT